MSSKKANLFDDITDSIKTRISQDTCDVLQSNIQQVKQHIRSVFKDHVDQLQQREEWLLHQADNMYDGLMQMHNNSSRRIAEERGRLRSCAELCKHSELKDCNSFHDYAAEIFQQYKTLLQQETHCSGLVKFHWDGGELSTSIRHFGKLSSTVVHDDGEQSDTSWDFADSETLSVASEDSKAKEITKKCVGVCGNCTDSAYDIEEMNKYFEEMYVQQSVTMNDVCKANEVCASLKECLCDVPCYTAPVKRVKEHTNPYVYNIKKAFEDMISFENKACSNNGSEKSSVKELIVLPSISFAKSDFLQQIQSIQDQFDGILEEKFVSSSSSQIDHKEVLRSSESVEALSAQIEGILLQSQKPSHVIENKCKAFSHITSQLNAILDDKLPTYGVSTEDHDNDRNNLASVVMNEISSMNQEKMNMNVGLQNKGDRDENLISTPEKYEATDTEKKWTTVEDVHAILLGILEG